MGSASSKHPTQELLARFADALIPPPEYYKKGSQVGEKIFNLIQANRRDFSRGHLGGAYGKGTAISDYDDDIDLVIFLNDQLPPFDQILEEFQKLLVQYYPDVKIMNETSLRFSSLGIKFDISIGVSTGGWLSDQRAGIIGKIKEAGDPFGPGHGHLYSPSLSEYLIDFINGKGLFVHRVIRLAKYWNKHVNMNTGSVILGRSLLIEMIAISACEKVKDGDICEALSNFLAYMIDFDNLEIYFTEYYSDYRFWNDIPGNVVSNKPYVLDPVNPYNNLAARITQSQMKTFSTNARNTLENWKCKYPAGSNISSIFTMDSYDFRQCLIKMTLTQNLQQTNAQTTPPNDPKISLEF